MIPTHAKLTENIFSPDIKPYIKIAPTRDGFGKGVVEAGTVDPRVVVLCADLKESTRAEEFEKVFPERFVEMGVAEQNMATVAAGMALAGKIPFIASYAAFSPGRNYEQIRTTIALNNVPVKVCGMHAGVSVGPDGATHQMLEDVGMMRMLPGMTVIVPADAEEARKAVIAAAKIEGPVYLRFGRAAVPVFTTTETPFEIGKAITLWDSIQADSVNKKVAIFTTGSVAYAAMVAARALSDGPVDGLTEKGIESVVVHFPTVKPLDIEMIHEVAHRVGHIITVEEHQVAGGFGSAVAEFLSENHPMPIKRLGIQDQFGQSGTPDELLSHYGLDAQSIESAVHTFI